MLAGSVRGVLSRRIALALALVAERGAGGAESASAGTTSVCADGDGERRLLARGDDCGDDCADEGAVADSRGPSDVEDAKSAARREASERFDFLRGSPFEIAIGVMTRGGGEDTFSENSRRGMLDAEREAERVARRLGSEETQMDGSCGIDGLGVCIDTGGGEGDDDGEGEDEGERDDGNGDSDTNDADGVSEGDDDDCGDVGEDADDSWCRCNSLSSSSVSRGPGSHRAHADAHECDVGSASATS